jgi:hypothetical protein
MYDDILGPVDELREIRSRKFNLKTKEKPKEELEELDLFEDLGLELEDIEEIE